MERGANGQGVLIVTSSGGVLLDMLGLRPWWAAEHTRWVAVAAPDTRELLAGQHVEWQPELTPRKVIALGQAVLRARRVLAEDPPAAVVSAGSGIAVPWFMAARLCGVPSFWVETFNVIGTPGLASRICGALATSVVVQHAELVGSHRRAVFVGALY